MNVLSRSFFGFGLIVLESTVSSAILCSFSFRFPDRYEMISGLWTRRAPFFPHAYGAFHPYMGSYFSRVSITKKIYIELFPKISVKTRLAFLLAYLFRTYCKFPSSYYKIPYEIDRMATKNLFCQSCIRN